MVVPVWEQYEPLDDDIVFKIEPGSVFGTGQHQTTQLCVEALERFVKQGSAVLDIGCGSGILGIVSLLLGAGFALACDFEPASAISAIENARLNNIEASRFQMETGNIFNDCSLIKKIDLNKYNIVIANIVSDAIIKLAPSIMSWLVSGGMFIASGIIVERLSEVLEVFEYSGYKDINYLSKDGWYLICGMKNA